MIVNLLRRAGFRGSEFHALSLGSVGLCIGLWIRAKTVDQDERGNAERRALFVGLWAPTLWQMGDSLGEVANAAPPRSMIRGGPAVSSAHGPKPGRSHSPGDADARL
jgi:hypothetical protein